MAALAVWCTAFSNSHYQVHNDPYVWRVTEWDTHKQARTVILIKPHSWYIWSKVRILFKDISPRCAERCVEIQDWRRSLGGVTTTWQLIATWEWELAAVDVRPALPFRRSEKLTRWQTDSCGDRRICGAEGWSPRWCICLCCRFPILFEVLLFLRWVLLSLVRLFLRSFSELSGQDVFNLPYLPYLQRKDKHSSSPFLSPNKTKPTSFDIIVVRGHVKEIDISDL